MSEHYTQGRQGQGARRRNNQGRHRRQRMPRPIDTPAKKPSLLARILSFFGFGKKKNKGEYNRKKGEKGNKNTPTQKVRVAKTNNRGGNPAAPRKRRATSTLPTRNARLYVGNLSYEATEAELEDLFKGFGYVKSVDVIYNPRTHKSKGYAFVEMHKLEDACKAAEVLHGQPFMGRELMVSAASERAEQADSAQDSEETATPAADTAPQNAAPAEAARPAEDTEEDS